MEPIPLIPKIDKCLDTTHIIREEFQEILGSASFPDNIAQNLNKSDVQYDLQVCGANVETIANRNKSILEDIRNAEKCILQSQTQYLADKKDVSGQELYKVKRIFPDIDRSVIDKFYLIRPEDLLPHISHRLLNSKFPEYNSIIKTTCIKPEKYYDLQNNFPFLQPKIKYEVKGDETKCTGRYRSLKDVDKTKVIFIAEPEEIVFENYKKNTVMEKIFNIRNISLKSAHFVRPITKDPKFSVETLRTSCKVAPGMSANFKIKYKNDTTMPYVSVLIIEITEGKDVRVKLEVRRRTPELQASVAEDAQVSIRGPKLKHGILTYKIDCGGCLWGYFKLVKITLKMVEGSGRFFLMSEDDWLFSEIKRVNVNMYLDLENFYVYPAFFRLEKGESIELQILFYPSSNGFHIDPVYMICDNSTFVTIDLLGDCDEFCLSYFQLVFPNGPQITGEQRYRNVLNMDCMYFRKPNIDHFSVVNFSSLRYKFKWRTRKCNKHLPMEDDWIVVVPDSGVLEPDRSTDFVVILTIGDDRPGIYSHYLSLFICDVPEMSLVEGFNFHYGEEYCDETDDDLRLLTVMVDEFRLEAELVQFPVHVVPERIEFRTLPKIEGSEWTHEVSVINNGPFPIKCKWIPPKIGNAEFLYLVVEPQHFEVDGMGTKKCSVAFVPGDFTCGSEEFVLCVNEGYATRTLSVSVEMRRPAVFVEPKYINFGVVKHNDPVKVNVSVFAEENLDVPWVVEEFKYYHVTKEMMPIDNGRNFRKLNRTDYEYTLRAHLPERWLSVLVFYTNYDGALEERNTILVMANIVQPDATVTGTDINQLLIQEKLYVEVPIEKTVTIRNRCIIPLSYEFGQIYGLDKNCMEVTVSSRMGVVDPLCRKKITLRIVPQIAKYVTDFFVPVAIEGSTHVLQIVCNVIGLCVVFSFPAFEKYFDVLWPPVEDACSVEFSTIDESPQQLSSGNSVSMRELNPSDFEIYHNGLPKAPAASEEPEESRITLPGTGTSVTSVSLDARHSVPSAVSLRSCFDSEATIQPYKICCRNLRCKKLYRKTIFIENITPRSMGYKVRAKNFAAKQLGELTASESHMVDLNWLRRDEWAERLGDHGIVVFPTPSQGEVKKEVELVVFVYADTFGVYLEEITFEVHDFPPFVVSFFVEIVGLPIDYPFALNCVTELPTFRFGTLANTGYRETRVLKVTNFSSIPIVVVWHVFISSNRRKKSLPFNLVADVFDDHGISFDFNLLQYEGRKCKVDNDIFKIEPEESHLKPKETTRVKLIVEPKFFKKKLTGLERIFGKLVGNIHVPANFRYAQSLYSRPTGSQLESTVVKLLMGLEKPRLDFLPESNKSRKVVMSANDLVLAVTGDKKLTIVFKNSGSSEFTIKTIIDEPFKVTQIETFLQDTEKKNRNFNGIVRAGEFVKINLRCSLNKVFVFNMATIVYSCKFSCCKLIEKLDNKTIQCRSDLKIFLNDKPSKKLPLYVIVHFPSIKVFEPVLDFGQVYIGSKKELSLHMSNKTASNVNLYLSVSNSKQFQLSTQKIEMEPAHLYEKFYHVIVTFLPKENLPYEAKIRIKSLFEQYEETVLLFGKGSVDENDFKPPLLNYANKHQIVK